MSSRQGVSGHLHSEHSACLTNAECQGKFLADAECQGKWDPDEAYDCTPHIGNRVVTVVALKCNCQGTVHCSEDY